MIKLEEKDLELINEFVKFLGGEETQDTEYPYAIRGIEILKDVEDKTNAFKEMFSLYAIASYENKTPITYAEFNENNVYLELKGNYVFKNENKYYIKLEIKKVDVENESKNN